MKKFITLIEISFLSATLLLPTHAKSDEEASYQYSFFVGYADATLDIPGADFDATGYQTGGTINFSQINLAAGDQPLAEVEFIKRTSNFAFRYEDREIKVNSLEVDLTEYYVALRLAGTSTNFTGGLEFIRTEVGLDFTTADIVDTEFDEVRVRGGYYIGDMTEIGVEYRNISSDDSGSEDVDIYAIDFKHVATATSRSPYGERNTALAIEAAIGYQDFGSETDFVWEADITVYLSNTFGVGFGYTDFIKYDIETEQRWLSLKWFVTPKAIIDLKYSEMDLGSSDITYEELTANLGMRF